MEKALAHIEGLALEIVKRSDGAKGFVVLPKRWIVEQTFALAQSLPPSSPRTGGFNRRIRGLAARRINPPYGSLNRTSLKIISINFQVKLLALLWQIKDSLSKLG